MLSCIYSGHVTMLVFSSANLACGLGSGEKYLVILQECTP
jgi:hypothetical protein